MKKAYDLTILNQKFTLKSEADEKHVKKVADYVNKKMFDIVSNNKAIATSNVAILAALNIADDFYTFRETKEKQVADWIDKLEGLVKKAEDNS